VCQIGAYPADNSADVKRAVQLISTSPIFLLKNDYPKQKDSGMNCLKDNESIQNLSICSGLMVTKALFFFAMWIGVFTYSD
jgi:hypothetical protein